jgi:hypothetical protein
MDLTKTTCCTVHPEKFEFGCESCLRDAWDGSVGYFTVELPGAELIEVKGEGADPRYEIRGWLVFAGQSVALLCYDQDGPAIEDNDGLDWEARITALQVQMERNYHRTEDPADARRLDQILAWPRTMEGM